MSRAFLRRTSAMANEISRKGDRYTSLTDQFSREISRDEMRKAAQNLTEVGDRMMQLREALPTIMEAVAEGRISEEKVIMVLDASVSVFDELNSSVELMLEAFKLNDIAEDNTARALAWIKRAEEYAYEAIGPY